MTNDLFVTRSRFLILLMSQVATEIQGDPTNTEYVVEYTLESLDEMPRRAGKGASVEEVCRDSIHLPRVLFSYRDRNMYVARLLGVKF